MTTGELWVSSPLFPALVWVLAMWMLFATVVFARNWVRLRKLERYTRSLADVINELKSRIRSETSEPATIEEVRTDRDYVTVDGIEDSQGAESCDSEEVELTEVSP